MGTPPPDDLARLAEPTERYDTDPEFQRSTHDRLAFQIAQGAQDRYDGDPEFGGRVDAALLLVMVAMAAMGQEVDELEMRVAVMMALQFEDEQRSLDVFEDEPDVISDEEWEAMSVEERAEYAHDISDALWDRLPAGVRAEARTLERRVRDGREYAAAVEQLRAAEATLPADAPAWALAPLRLAVAFLAPLPGEPRA